MALPVLPLIWRQVFVVYQNKYVAFLIILMQVCVAYAAPTYTIIKDNAEAASTVSSLAVPTITPTTLYKNFSNAPSLESQMQKNNLDAVIKNRTSNIVAIMNTERYEEPYSTDFEAAQTTPSVIPRKSYPIQKIAQEKNISNTESFQPLTEYNNDETTTIRNDEEKSILHHSSELPETTSVDKDADHFSLMKGKTEGEVRQESGDILKLIDLEKYDIKSGSEKNIEKTSADGHDGVKLTKKKQLTDRHYISTTDIIHSTRLADLVLSSSRNKTPAPIPTFKPIQNGFLGPILMEEKTFTAIHSRKVPQKHQSFIESQLKDGKLVEIIAPTALLQEQKTPIPHSDIISTTMVAPEIKKNESPNVVSVLSTTVFQVPDAQTSTTRLPSSTIFQTVSKKRPRNNQTTSFSGSQHSVHHNQQTESRISDIQIEVYESTLEPYVSSTNKENEGYFSSPLDLAVIATRPPLLSSSQERFTQYVIDHTDLSTPESNIAFLPLASGKPEPAAIEIHINVSEGMGNESEDLEFSYRQSEFLPISVPIQATNASINSIKMVNVQSKNNTTDSDELLVVEIIDTGDNNTENSASFENLKVNPIFTFNSDNSNDGPLKNIKLTAEISHLRENVSDDLFMPDVRKKESKSSMPSAASAAPPPKSMTPERDSDTIFYISNTEVKVGESLPTANINSEQQLRKNKLESQFFPVNYLTSTHPNVIKLEERQRYEEEIILSPIHNTASSVKIIRSQNENSPPLDVTYVGESVIEVEQLSGGSIVAATSGTVAPQGSDVIIQPAILPEISIGVPIIGELPPQIELKEIEYLPNETNDQRLRVYENSEKESLGNEIDKIMESSIQYGGDLIDEGGVIEGGGFDGAEASYPLGNLANAKPKAMTDADFFHIMVSHGVSNLKRNDLTADIAGLTDVSIENVTLKEILLKNETDFVGNGTAVIAERSSNATAFSVMEDPSPITDANLNISDVQTLVFACLATLLPLVVAVFLVFGLRYFYQKYQSTGVNGDDSTNQLANGKSGEGDDRDEPTKRPYQRDILTTFSTTGTTAETTAKGRSDSGHNTATPSNCNNVFCEKSLGGFGLANGPTFNSHAALNQLAFIPSSYSGPNGSVTTMTLKNNHLIVETEERNDISRDARVTKMHYNSADKDGVFVVEVSRGVDSEAMANNVSDNIPSQRLRSIEQTPITSAMLEVKKSHEEVQIHQPPQERNNSKGIEDLKTGLLQQIEEVDETVIMPNTVTDHVEKINANTGLSQSDLSSTSSADSNKQYSYGNQELYSAEHNVYSNHLPKVRSPLQAPAEEEQDDDHKSENGHKMEHPTTQIQNDNSRVCQKINDENQNDMESNTCNSNKEEQLETIENLGNENILIPGERREKSYEKMISETSNHMINSENIENRNIKDFDFNEYDRNGDSEENGYDSILSLPDPPSTEEIKQLNNFSMIEAHQLDSLPPPSPPPPLLTNGTDKNEIQNTKNLNGDLYHIECTKPYKIPPELTELTEEPVPLTPPASPEHYNNNGTNGILLSAPVPLTIDVNSS